MKNYLRVIILIILVLSGTVFYAKKSEDIRLGAARALKEVGWLTVCDETLYYSLGNIDPRFNISEEEIKAIISEAESVWESELGKNVFQYRDGAEFKINFIFDERQQRANEKNKLDLQLDKLEENKNNISQEYNKLKASYEKALTAYEKNIKIYESRVDSFNKEAKKVDREVGITKEEYEKLKNEQGELEKMQDKLEGDKEEINEMVSRINSLAKKENGIVNNYNQEVQTYQDRYGEANEFNQGEYDGLNINIYQFYDKTDLKLVLAHELGHALEIDHVENPQSLMYYLMEKQDLENIRLTNEDLNAIKNICKMN